MFYFTNGINRIGIPIDCFIRQDDEFISFDLNEYWYLHSKECEDCKNFFNDILPIEENIPLWVDNKPLDRWFFNDGENYYKLIPNNFSANEYFDNKMSFIDFNKTECKLKVEKCEAPEGYIKYFEDMEYYEICAFIRDQQKQIELNKVEVQTKNKKSI